MKKNKTKHNSLKKAIEDSIIAKNSLFLIEDKIKLAIKEIYKRISKGGKIFLWNEVPQQMRNI